MPHSTHDPQSAGPPERKLEAGWEDYLSRLCDASLLGVLFVAPLFMGGRHPLGQWVYVLLVCVALVSHLASLAMSRRGVWRWTGVEWLLLAGGCLIGLQLLPLPAALTGLISPSTRERLPLFFDGPSAGFLGGSWRTLSFFPDATRGGLVLFSSHALLWLVVSQRITTAADVTRWLHRVSLACVACAGLGILQLVGSNGKFLWLYEHPFRDTLSAAKGPFSNENHFAHFLALGLGPLLFAVQQAFQAGRQNGRLPSFVAAAGSHAAQVSRIGWCLALAGVAFAGMLSFSRGGVLVMFLSAASCMGLYYWQGLLPRRAFAWLGLAGGVLAVALAIHGYSQLRQQFTAVDATSVASLQQSLGREKIWRADTRVARDFFWSGTGVGTHRQAYPLYFEAPDELEYSHAESGYLQILVETGVGGLLLALAAIAIAGSWAVTCLRYSKGPLGAAGAALAASLLASIVHSLWDFVWYIPATFSFTILLAACLCRTAHLVQQRQQHPARQAKLVPPAPRRRRLAIPESFNLPRWGWLAVTLVAAAASLGLVQQRWGPARARSHWDAYFRVYKSLDAVEWALAAAPTATGGREAQTMELLRRMISHLEAHVEAQPGAAVPHIRLAEKYLLLFNLAQLQSDNPMVLSQIRDAALASRFASPADLDAWLERAIGENRKLLHKALAHARQGLKLCPLQGEGYIYLAETSFLLTPDQELKRKCVAQALATRPYDGAVLLAAGNEAALEGRLADAASLWKRSFHRKEADKVRVIEMLAPSTTADLLVQFLEPDLTGLRYLYRHYRLRRRTEEIAALAPRLGHALGAAAKQETGPAAARLWREASDVYDAAGQTDLCLDCLRRAITDSPRDYALQRRLALRLVTCRAYSEALEPLEWCARRQTGDREIETALSLARREHVRQSTRGVVPATAVLPVEFRNSEPPR